ncbi:MAG: ATPase, partial [Lachnospiraceae bacterium]
AAATNTPITVMDTAGEGGAWGIALLAAYRRKKKEDETLEDFLLQHVFEGTEGTTVVPNPGDVVGFDEFMKRYQNGLPIERMAIDFLK